MTEQSHDPKHAAEMAVLPWKRMSRIWNFDFRISILFLAIAAVLSLPCLPWAPAQTSPGASLTQAPAAQTQPSTSQTKSEDLLTQADELFQEMSRITGLPIKAPLKKRTVSRKEIEEFLIHNLHAEYTPQEIQVQQATLQAFGLVSRDFDLEKFLIRFFTEQAAGFYDPRRKTMFIADWIKPQMQQLVLAHELTHALEDQNFDLEKFLRAARENDDATNARQAVTEGHATAAMVQKLIGSADLSSFPSLEPLMAQFVQQQMQEFPVFATAPYFFRLQAIFPYTGGMNFMQRGLEKGGWTELNAVFLNPPTSTKEIFEPDVYFARKPLPKVSLPFPPVAGLKKLRLLTQDIMGELGYRALLGQFISEEEAKAVGKAWLGDRYILYEGPRPPQYVLVARTRWSNSESALAFFRDYHEVLAKKFPELAPDKRSAADLFIGSVSSGQVIVLRKGDECLWAEGISASQTDTMLAWLRSL